MCNNFCMQNFARKITEDHVPSRYNYITDKLPVSIKDRAYQRLLNHSHKPIPLNQISEKNKRIEDYLHHTLEIYQKSLDRNHKTMDRKKPRPQSWPECLVPDNESKTENKSCDHRAEINDLAKYELIV